MYHTDGAVDRTEVISGPPLLSVKSPRPPACFSDASAPLPVLSEHLVLVIALVERWTRDRKVAGSTPGRGAIKSTKSTQPSIPTR